MFDYQTVIKNKFLLKKSVIATFPTVMPDFFNKISTVIAMFPMVESTILRTHMRLEASSSASQRVTGRRGPAGAGGMQDRDSSNLVK